MLESITHALTSFIGDYGLYAVFLLMLVDAVLPAASELVMVYGGALAAGAFAQSVSVGGHGFDAFVAIALAGTIGYLIGSWIGWWIGLYGGRPLIEKRGKWLHLSPEKLDRAERWFERWGDWGVFLGRLTPVIRSFVSIPAGVFRLRFWSYTVLTLIGSAIWCFALAGAGYAFGSNYETFHHAWRFVDYLVGAAIVAGIFYLLLRRRRSTMNRRAGDTAR